MYVYIYTHTYMNVQNVQIKLHACTSIKEKCNTIIQLWFLVLNLDLSSLRIRFQYQPAYKVYPTCRVLNL